MTGAEIIAEIRDEYPELLLADGFDDAVIGLVEGGARGPVVCYDYARCVEILMERSEMDADEAAEYLSFNAVGAFVGPETPMFLHDWRRA